MFLTLPLGICPEISQPLQLLPSMKLEIISFVPALPVQRSIESSKKHALAIIWGMWARSRPAFQTRVDFFSFSIQPTTLQKCSRHLSINLVVDLDFQISSSMWHMLSRLLSVVSIIPFCRATSVSNGSSLTSTLTLTLSSHPPFPMPNGTRIPSYPMAVSVTHLENREPSQKSHLDIHLTTSSVRSTPKLFNNAFLRSETLALPTNSPLRSEHPHLHIEVNLFHLRNHSRQHNNIHPHGPSRQGHGLCGW